MRPATALRAWPDCQDPALTPLQSHRPRLSTALFMTRVPDRLLPAGYELR